MPTFGNNIYDPTYAGDLGTTCNIDQIIVSKFILNETATIQKLTAYLYWGAGAMRAVIYADAGGVPGQLVAVSSEQAVSGDGWKQFPITVVLPPGTYWLGLWSNHNQWVNWTTGTPNQYVKAGFITYSTTGNPTSPFPSANVTFSDRALAIYADYMPGEVGTLDIKTQADSTSVIATIQFELGTFTTSDFPMIVPTGLYNITATYAGLPPQTQPATVNAAQTTTVTFQFAAVTIRYVSVLSQPIPGIAFSIETTTYTTPKLNIALPERTGYTLQITSPITVGGVTYTFKNWLDGDTTNPRIFDLTAATGNRVFTANFESATPPASGKLRTDGRFIRDKFGAGNIIVLRGVNRGHGEDTASMKFGTHTTYDHNRMVAELDLMKTWGINYLRLYDSIAGWVSSGTDANHTSDMTGMATGGMDASLETGGTIKHQGIIKDIVYEAGLRGIYVSYIAWNANIGGAMTLPMPPYGGDGIIKSQQDFLDWAMDVVNKLKGSYNMIWEFFSEPHEGIDLWYDTWKKLIPLIRAVSDHLILVQWGYGGSAAPGFGDNLKQWITAYPMEAQDGGPDVLNNILYSTHLYRFHDAWNNPNNPQERKFLYQDLYDMLTGTGNFPNSNINLLDILNAKAQGGLEKPLIVGECGAQISGLVDSMDNEWTAFDNSLKIFNLLGVSWAAWDWWSGHAWALINGCPKCTEPGTPTQSGQIVINNIGVIQRIISGKVIDANGIGIPNVQVTAGAYTTFTNAAGDYSLSVVAGSYTIVFSKAGYQTYQTTVDVTSGDAPFTNATLTPTPTHTISGTVTDASGTPLAGADVSADTLFTTKTLANGTYSLPVNAGIYNLAVSLSGYQSATVPNVDASAGDITGVNATLTPISPPHTRIYAFVQGLPRVLGIWNFPLISAYDTTVMRQRRG